MSGSGFRVSRAAHEAKCLGQVLKKVVAKNLRILILGGGKSGVATRPTLFVLGVAGVGAGVGFRDISAPSATHPVFPGQP